MKKLALVLGITSIITMVGLAGLLLLYAYSYAFHPPKSNLETQTRPLVRQEAPTVNELLRLINDERAKAGVSPLALHPSINSSAQNKSDDMVINDYYAHVNPKTGVDGWKTIPSQDLGCVYASENINGGLSSDYLVDSWMHSTPHKKAILDPKYDLTGFGISKQGNQYLAVQHFCDL